MSGPASDSSSEGLQSTVKAIVEAATVLSVLAFSAGWSCLYSYYNQFGLGLFDIDLPVPATAMFAIRVLVQSAWPWVAFLAGLAGYFAVRRWLRAPSGAEWFHGFFVVTELLAGVIVLSFAGVEVGHKRAVADIHINTSELPAAGFITQLSGNSDALPACLLDVSKTECRLLAHSKGFYFVFEPVKSNKDSPNILVYSIPDAQVRLVRLETGLR